MPDYSAWGKIYQIWGLTSRLKVLIITEMAETLRTLTTELFLIPVNLVKLDSSKCTWVRICMSFSSMRHLTDLTPIPLMLLCSLYCFLLFFPSLLSQV